MRIAAVLLLGLTTSTGCGEKQTHKAAAAPTKGVVGKVLRVRGTVTYSLEPGGEPKPLTPGMELRAEWTVHTGPDGELTARLSNGHRWTLASDLSKRVSKITALTLAPVKEGTVAQLSDLGARGGKDRSAAAGLHQERTAGTQAAPSRAPRSSRDSELDEVATPTDSPPASTKPSPGKRARKTVRKAGSRGSRTRSARRPPRRRAALEGLFDVRRRGGGGGKLGGELSRSRSPVRPPRPSPSVDKAPAGTASETLPKRLTRAQMDRIIRPLRARLAGCLKTHKVTKAVSLRLVVRGADGRVSAVRVVGRTGGDKVVRCLLGRARALRFPRFSAATQTTHTIRLKAP